MLRADGVIRRRRGSSAGVSAASAKSGRDGHVPGAVAPPAMRMGSFDAPARRALSVPTSGRPCAMIRPGLIASSGPVHVPHILELPEFMRRGATSRAGACWSFALVYRDGPRFFVPSHHSAPVSKRGSSVSSNPDSLLALSPTLPETLLTLPQSPQRRVSHLRNRNVTQPQLPATST